MRHPESSALPAAGPLLAVLPQLEHCGHPPVQQLGRRPWSRVVGTAGKLAKNFQEIVFEFEVSQKKRKVSKEWQFYNRAARGFITSLIMRVSGEIKCQRRTIAEGYTYVEVHVLAVDRTRHVLGSCCPTYSLSAVSCKSREPRCLKLGRHDSRDHEDWIRLVDKD